MVHVNMSAQQITDAGLVQYIQEQCELNGLDPSCLIVELTETSLVNNFSQATELCHSLMKLGIGVAFSAVGVFAVQGLLTLAAVLAAGAIPTMITGEMIAVGSLLVIAIGTNLLGITKIKVMNYVPAMFLPIGLCPLYELLFAV